MSKRWTTNLSSPILPGSPSQSQHSVKEMNYKPVPPDPPWFTLAVTAQCQRDELQTCPPPILPGSRSQSQHSVKEMNYKPVPPRSSLVHAHSHSTVSKRWTTNLSSPILPGSRSQSQHSVKVMDYKPVLPDPPWFTLTVTAQCQRDELQTCPPRSTLVHSHSHSTVSKMWTTNLFPPSFLGSRSQSRYSVKEFLYLQTCPPRSSLVHPHSHSTVSKRWTTNLSPLIFPCSRSQSRYSVKEMNYKPVSLDLPWFTLTVTVQ